MLIDLDECQNVSMCGNNSECKNIYGSFVCSCVAGFDLTTTNDCEGWPFELN